MSEIKVNKITPTADCGTVTLGDSGDTLSIPSGVTVTASDGITNSGTITNTGTISGGTINGGQIDILVDWQTSSIKTANFTAVAFEGYFCNTTSSAFTVTLPASPNAGDIVALKDYLNTFDTNNLTIDGNGENIQGSSNDFVIQAEGGSISLIYVDSTQGWLSTSAAKASDVIPEGTFTVATGGNTVVNAPCGNYKLHIFSSPGTFQVTQLGNSPISPLGGPASAEYLVAAGGGSGGGDRAGGGGGGGVRTDFPSPSGTIPLSVTSYPITVGGGGAGVGDGSKGNNGSNSTFSTITSQGGGGGGQGSSSNSPGKPGGSGGGGAGPCGADGVGNSPPVSPPQGNPSGRNVAPLGDLRAGGGGGGGKGGTGGDGGPTNGGNGGNGQQYPTGICPPSFGGPPGGRYFGAGGGGGRDGRTSGSGGSGGTGGGGNGQSSSNPTSPARPEPRRGPGGGNAGARPRGRPRRAGAGGARCPAQADR